MKGEVERVGKRFKWDMFVTSFMPLWISILVIDIWDIVDASITNWNGELTVKGNLLLLLHTNLLLITSVAIITTVVIVSMVRIRIFLKECNAQSSMPKGIIKSARRANKLSSEFLLAYILPMIAFNYNDIKNIVLFLIYFSVLAFLCIKNNNVYTNIYLEFLGYKMYECDIECFVLENTHNYKSSLIISPVDLTLEINNDVPYWDFDNYIYIILNSRGETNE